MTVCLPFQWIVMSLTILTSVSISLKKGWQKQRTSCFTLLIPVWWCDVEQIHSNKTGWGNTLSKSAHIFWLGKTSVPSLKLKLVIRGLHFKTPLNSKGLWRCIRDYPKDWPSFGTSLEGGERMSWGHLSRSALRWICPREGNKKSFTAAEKWIRWPFLPSTRWMEHDFLFNYSHS